MTGSSSEKLLSNLGKGERAVFRSASFRLFFFPSFLLNVSAHKANIPAWGVWADRPVLRRCSIPVKRSKVSLEPTHEWVTRERRGGGGLGRRRLLRRSQEESGDLKKELRPANQEMRNRGILKRRKHLTAAGAVRVGGTGVEPGLK